jgi:hypothetical protein
VLGRVRTTGRVVVAVVEEPVAVEAESGELRLEQVEQLEPVFEFGEPRLVVEDG